MRVGVGAYKNCIGRGQGSWWKESSVIEKTMAFFLGFFLGDSIEKLLKDLLFIDSFLLTTVTGILSILPSFCFPL